MVQLYLLRLYYIIASMNTLHMHIQNNPVEIAQRQGVGKFKCATLQ